MSRYNQSFNVGDIVISLNGSKPFRVTSVWGNRVEGRYLHSDNPARFAQGQVKHYDENEKSQKEKGKEMSQSIYQVTLEDGATTFGTKAGATAQGKVLIEEKGTGKILIVDEDKLEEQLPYTFAVRTQGNTQHYIGKPGSVEKGDIVIVMDGGVDKFTIGMVSAIDTKNKTATKAFSGRKLTTEAL